MVICNKDGCLLQASCGLKNSTREYCSYHKINGMISLTSTRCKFNKCVNRGVWGIDKKEYCYLHKNNEMFNFVSKKEKYNSESLTSIYDSLLKLHPVTNKKILLFNKLYKIDRNGIIINNKGNIIKQKQKGFYKIVNLKKGSITFGTSVHRILHLTFSPYIPEDFEKKHVDHKDNNSCNNTINNLQMLTPQENTSKSNISNKISTKNISIVSTNISTNEKSNFISISECSRVLNIPCSNISNVLKNKRKSAKGFFFQKSEEFEVFNKLKLNEYCKNFKTCKITNFGRVISSIGIFSLGTVNDSGYKIFISDGKNYIVHRIVLMLFGNFNNNLVVHHKDGIRDHNCVNNLESITITENNQQNNRNIISLDNCSYCGYIR